MLTYQYSTPHKGVNSLIVSFLYVQMFLKKIGSSKRAKSIIFDSTYRK